MNFKKRQIDRFSELILGHRQNDIPGFLKSLKIWSQNYSQVKNGSDVSRWKREIDSFSK